MLKSFRFDGDDTTTPTEWLLDDSKRWTPAPAAAAPTAAAVDRGGCGAGGGGSGVERCAATRRRMCRTDFRRGTYKDAADACEGRGCSCSWTSISFNACNGEIPPQKARPSGVYLKAEGAFLCAR